MVGTSPRKVQRVRAWLVRDRRGAVLIEFALVLPMLLTLVAGMLCYGQYIWLAHSVQAAANDAARAIVAGVTPAERRTLAQAAVANGLTGVAEVTTDKVTLVVDELGSRATVRLRVDARALTLLSTGMVPLPEPVIERRAVAILAAS